MWDLNHHYCLERHNKHRQGHKFPTTSNTEVNMGSTLLDFMLINKKGLAGNIRFVSILVCGNNKMIKIRVLRRRNKAKRKFITLAFGKAKADLFRNLLERIP